ncbi:MAG: GNAT family N-acetyltransferase [Erysipelotrichales bacterium]|nr:GNAT family N-acetyltransferase [Erysipelotrichales bacterium]
MIYDIYLQSLPDYYITKENFNQSLKPEKAKTFFAYDKEKIVGFTLVHKNHLTLICVLPAYQRQKYGTKMLKKAEEFILESGYSKINLGGGPASIFQGATINSKPFFESFGYKANWTSVNMMLAIKDFSLKNVNIPAVETNISFRLAKETDKIELLKAVNDADSSWLEIFKNCTEPVLLAIEDNKKIVGFEIFSNARFKQGYQKASALGCVGVIQSARQKGIGRRMVLEGIIRLKEQGVEAIELLYVALVDWYGRLGFKVVSEQWMAEKIIK